MSALINVTVKRILVVALVMLIGCRDSDKNSSLIFEELNESLERSNKNLELSTNMAINNLESKQRQPATAERANVWSNRAYSVIESSKRTIDFIDSIQAKIVKANESEAKKYSERLDTMLKKYEESVLTSDLNERKGFNKRIHFHEIKPNILSDKIKSKTLLLKLKNDVRNMENMAVNFCENQIGCLDCGALEKYQLIAVSNSKVLKKGQEIIVYAGMGEFNNKNKPSFLINNINVPSNENGVGEYKMKIRNKPGDYKVHIKISFFKPDGRKDTLEKDIEYTVVE